MEASRVEAIYEQIGKFSVDLSADAWSKGPRHVYDLIALTRGYLNSINFILQEIMQEKQRLDREKHAAEAVLSIERDRTLVENDRARHGPNIQDRQSTVNLILHDHVQRVHSLEAQILDLGYVEKVVRHRYNELKATMSDIKAQRALIRDAIDSGSYYGDENETSRGSLMSTPSSPSSPSSSTPGFTDDAIDREMDDLNNMLLHSGVSEKDTSVEEHESTAAIPPDLTPKESKPKKKGGIPKPEVPNPVPAQAAEDDFLDLIEGLEKTPPVSEEPKEPVEDPDLARFLDDDDFSLDSLESV